MTKNIQRDKVWGYLEIPGSIHNYTGKVCENYLNTSNLLFSVKTDRISAFNEVLPVLIPHKGEILNRISNAQFEAIRDSGIITPWTIANAGFDRVSIGLYCDPIMLEIVLRAYIAGSMWKAYYEEGRRKFWGVILPDGLKENDKLPHVMLTPTLKSEADEEVTEEQILRYGIVNPGLWKEIKETSFKLFEFGSKQAEKKNLILVDTKYEFGKGPNSLIAIDELHTPDSSRYFYKDSYEALEDKSKARHLSKEFVRKWLKDHGFEGGLNEVVPYMDENFANEISARYQELYENFMGEKFYPTNMSPYTITQRLIEYAV